jgi:long-subunit acyl-CoA synthetase (AMP-forming)
VLHDLLKDCLEENLHKRFPKLQFCLNGYGMTELGLAVTISYSHKQLGGVYDGNVVKFVDSDTGEALGPNQVGEFLVRPPHHMKGYLNRPEEEKAFFASDGFCRTGDLGHYDEEGVMYYDGRIKDLIKPAGCHHVYPQEIEDIIHKMQGVVEVALSGRSTCTCNFHTYGTYVGTIKMFVSSLN